MSLTLSICFFIQSLLILTKWTGVQGKMIIAYRTQIKKMNFLFTLYRSK